VESKHWSEVVDRLRTPLRGGTRIATMARPPPRVYLVSEVCRASALRTLRALSIRSLRGPPALQCHPKVLQPQLYSILWLIGTHFFRDTPSKRHENHERPHAAENVHNPLQCSEEVAEHIVCCFLYALVVRAGQSQALCGLQPPGRIAVRSHCKSDVCNGEPTRRTPRKRMIMALQILGRCRVSLKLSPNPSCRF
jgi:hypothetical protein